MDLAKLKFYVRKCRCCFRLRRGITTNQGYSYCLGCANMWLNFTAGRPWPHEATKRSFSRN